MLPSGDLTDAETAQKIDKHLWKFFTLGSTPNVLPSPPLHALSDDDRADARQRRKEYRIEAAHGECTECGKRTGLGVCPPCRESR